MQALLRRGKGMLAVARDVGVGSGTVQRVARESRPLALSTAQVKPHESSVM
jgi:hypothetical protein